MALNKRYADTYNKIKDTYFLNAWKEDFILQESVIITNLWAIKLLGINNCAVDRHYIYTLDGGKTKLTNYSALNGFYLKELTKFGYSVPYYINLGGGTQWVTD